MTSSSDEDRGMIKITLKAARVNAGLAQAEAADLIGVTPLTIINWEAGRYKPTPERYPAIEAAYKIPIEHIII